MVPALLIIFGSIFAAFIVVILAAFAERMGTGHDGSIYAGRTLVAGWIVCAFFIIVGIVRLVYHVAAG